MNGFVRNIYVILGWILISLGVIGLFLPLVPTTPFLIGAAFFFSKGSPKLHRWLLSRPHFGPVIRDWETHGVIRTRAKLVATLMIVPAFSVTSYFVLHLPAARIAFLAVGGAILIFLWTRPAESTRR